MMRIFIVLGLASLVTIGLPAYGGGKNGSSTYDVKTGAANFDTTLRDLNSQTHGKNLSEFIHASDRQYMRRHIIMQECSL